MKKMLALISLFGFLLVLYVPARAAMNLLWDIPTDLDEDAYVRAVEDASGVPLVLDEEYGNYNGYWSPDGMDITLYDAPAQLRVGFDSGDLVSASLSVNTAQFSRGGTGAQATNAVLDYQQTLVEALSAKFGAPTGGYIRTSASDIHTNPPGTIVWDYPGLQDGSLNRGQMDAAIAKEWLAELVVFWDNVMLSLSWDERFADFPTGVSVHYAFNDTWEHPNAEGFSWGQRYPSGEDWTKEAGEAEEDISETTGSSAFPARVVGRSKPLAPKAAPNQYLLWDDKEAWVAKGAGGKYDVDISIPQISGLVDQHVQDTVNATLRSAI